MATSIINRNSSIITWILPKHYSSIPFILLICLRNTLAKYFCVHPASIWSITWCNGLTNNQFLSRNSSCNNFFQWCSRKVSSSISNKFTIRIIFCITLIIKLNVIEIYWIANLLIYCYIGSIFVVLLFEIRSLWGVRNNVCRQYLS